VWPKRKCVADPYRQQIGRIVVEQRAPDRESLGQRPIVPGGKCRHMALLALRGDAGPRLGGCDSGGDGPTMRRVGACEQEIALKAMAHDEAGISRERLIQQAHRVEMEFQIVFHRAVEQCGSLGAVRGKRQTACITLHFTTSMRRVMSNYSQITRPEKPAGQTTRAGAS
jgi:hypothetical protein